jgi:hypothetical protein
MPTMSDYFIRVPVPTGERFQFVRVDVGRLHPGIIREIFARLPSGGMNSHTEYSQVHGVENTVNTRVDLSEIKETFEDLSSQVSVALDAFGESGAKVFGLIKEMDFLRLMEAIANGHARTTIDVLREIMFSLMGTGCMLAGELRGAEDSASGTMVALDHFQTTLNSQDGIASHLFAEWALAAADLNEAVKHLDEMEADLRSTLASIERGRQRWRTSLSPAHPIMSRAIALLDGPDNPEDSFFFRAARHIQDPTSVPEMKQVIRQARERVDECKMAVTTAHTEWQGLRSLVEMDIFPKKPSMDRFLGQLGDATKRMHDFASRFPKGSVKPYEMNAGGLISQEAFERAESVLQDQRLSPLTYRSRIEGIFGSTLSLLKNSPELADPIAEILRLAESYFEQLAETSEGSEVALVETVALPSGSDEEEPDEIQTTEAQPAIDESRLNELAQFAICVGSVLTDNQYFLAVSNARAMLRVVQEMELCTENEVAEYSKHVEQMFRQKEMCEDVDAPRVRERRTKSKVMWLLYDTKTSSFQRRGLKMTVRGGEVAKGLMTRLSLTEERIATAHATKREKARKTALARKAVRTGQD